MSMDDEGTTLRHCEVVDGQQRLITCFLLLDRVRSCGLRCLTLAALSLPASWPGTSGIGTASYESTTRRRPRLRLGNELNAYWVSVVLGDDAYVGPGLIAGEWRLKDAMLFFDAKLESIRDGVSDALEFARLRELQRRINTALDSWSTKSAPWEKSGSSSRRSTSAVAN